MNRERNNIIRNDNIGDRCRNEINLKVRMAGSVTPMIPRLSKCVAHVRRRGTEPSQNAIISRAATFPHHFRPKCVYASLIYAAIKNRSD